MGLECISSTKKSTISSKTSIYVKFEHKTCDLKAFRRRIILFGKTEVK